jgi:hypothetical protein
VDRRIFKWFRLLERKTLCPLMLYCYECMSLFKLELNSPKKACLNSVSVRSFYSSRSNNYIETWGLTGGPKVVENLYNI